MNRQKAKAFQFTPLREGRHVGETAVAQHTLFQFTPLREGRLGTMGSRLLWSIFQFTPLREGRRVLLPSPSPSFYFNSRPSARGDSACCLQVHALTAFQFTPLREGRPHGDAVIMPIAPFQFTPLREGRQGARPFCQRRREFQFTPLREGRRLVSDPRCTFLNFNSRPSARGDAR